MADVDVELLRRTTILPGILANQRICVTGDIDGLFNVYIRRMSENSHWEAIPGEAMKKVLSDDEVTIVMQKVREKLNGE